MESPTSNNETLILAEYVWLDGSGGIRGAFSTLRLDEAMPHLIRSHPREKLMFT